MKMAFYSGFHFDIAAGFLVRVNFRVFMMMMKLGHDALTAADSIY